MQYFKTQVFKNAFNQKVNHVSIIILNQLKKECYATPWPLWRESRILWHIVETSFAFGSILSLSASLIALSFLSLGGLMRPCRPEGKEGKTGFEVDKEIFKIISKIRIEKI